MKKLDHVNLVVSDLNAGAEFFKRLGFEEGDSSELSGEWISDIVGLNDVDASYVSLRHPGSSTALELIEYRHPPCDPDPHVGDANRPGFRHLALEVDDIHAEVQRLREQGVVFVSEVRTYPKTGKKLVYFHGPDHILLELAEYPAGS